MLNFFLICEWRSNERKLTNIKNSKKEKKRKRKRKDLLSKTIGENPICTSIQSMHHLLGEGWIRTKFIMTTFLTLEGSSHANLNPIYAQTSWWSVFLFFQFYQVGGGVAIIQKMNKPNLGRGQQASNCLLVSCFVLLTLGTDCLNIETFDFCAFRKKILYTLCSGFCFAHHTAQCKNSPRKRKHWLL